MLRRHSNHRPCIVRRQRRVAHLALLRNDLLRLLVATSLVNTAAVREGTVGSSYVGVGLPRFQAEAVVLVHSLQALGHGVVLVHVGEVDARVHPLDFIRGGNLSRAQILQFL
uniref:Uncharacterized protein n=1 Tax=Strombidium inclinatum TaxID=197538 RepID=A0A7S3IHY8_9SPIT